MSERARARDEQRAAELEAALRPVSEANLRPEVVVTRLRRHASILTVPVIVLLATAFAAGFFIGSLPDAWMNWLAIAVTLLLIVALGLLPLSIWLGNTTTVTTRRVIVRRGLLTRTRTEVALGRIREIRVRASLWQRAFRTGTIQLVTDLDNPVELVDAPGVNGVVDMLHELLDRAYSGADGGRTPTADSTGVAPQVAANQPQATTVLTESHLDIDGEFDTSDQTRGF
jgi:membrane protein YdbS with pleckstrin-like domain